MEENKPSSTLPPRGLKHSATLPPAEVAEMRSSSQSESPNRIQRSKSARSLQRQRTVDVKIKYKIRQKLGSGAFATVRRVVEKSTGANYALKMIRKKGMDEFELDNLEHEIKILQQIDNAYCIKLHDAYFTATYTYLVCDYCSGGELFDVLTAKKVLSEQETSDIIRQIALALDYLHSKNIIHRDIKPENLLLTDSGPTINLKLCDFGLARVVPEEGLVRACGTPTYVAPEVIKPDVRYGTSADWWSVGVILYLLLCGFPPFWDPDPKRLFRKIKNGFIFFPAPYWDHVSLDARNLILGLLTVKPENRYTSKQLLNHTWVKRDANEENMSSQSRNELRRFTIRAKMKRAANTCLALTKLITTLVDPEMTVEELVNVRNKKMLEKYFSPPSDANDSGDM